MDRRKERSILVRGIRSASSCDTEAWFLIRRTSNGSMEAPEVFQPASDKLPGDSLDWEVSCAQIGSSLYVLGGRTPQIGKMYVFSDSVRRIDLKNPDKGWQPCKPLPYRCGVVPYSAAGDLVYLFPTLRSDPDNPGGFVYRLSDEKGYAISPPPRGCKDNETWDLPYLVAFDYGEGNRGLITQLQGASLLEKYDPDKKLWKELGNFILPNPLSAMPPQHAVWDEILYLSFCDWNENGPVTTMLHGYDILSGSRLLGKKGQGITLPEFTKLKKVEVGWVSSAMRLVAVSDNTLCYVWHQCQSSVNQLKVTIATVEVSADRLSCALVSEEEFFLNVRTIQNIIPLLVSS